ncbi:hypothetical protein C8J56DRAFT_879429 [Mycena floridula]|nr:hypothetical protein C8J56DRAFT_879429 [Mycena floridula]
MSSSPIVDAPSTHITLERSVYWGQIFMTWLYGIEVFAFCYSAHRFFSSRHASRLYLIFGGVLLALMTITVSTDAVLCQFMWIDYRGWPGGPVEYLVMHISTWWQVLGTAASQATDILGASFLLYRCYVIYNGRWKVIILPLLIHLVASAMAIVLIVHSAMPGNQFHDLVAQIRICWAALAVTVNVIVTVLIVVRTLRARRSMKNHVPDRKDSINTCTSTMAILVESSLPFTIIGLTFVITYGKNPDIGAAFLFVWQALSALSPQLIIFRIASGRAWTRRVAADVSQALYSQETSDISGIVVQGTVFENKPESVFTKKTLKSEKLHETRSRRNGVTLTSFRYTGKSPRSSSDSFECSGEDSV